ncbi:hypothetical protein ABPG74_015241 [Tetrahymena malaccensis]
MSINEKGLNCNNNFNLQKYAQYEKQQKEDSSHSTEQIQKNNEKYRVMQYYNDHQNSKLKKKKLIQKNQAKNVVYGYKRILKLTTQNLNENQLQLENIILKEIPSQKTFFIAGDILVELIETNDLEACSIFNEFRNIVQVEKTSQSLCFQLESIQPLQHIARIIYYLERSQDQQLYDFAQNLKNHQQTIFLINDQIARLKQNYLINQLDYNSMLYLRKQFVEKEKKKFIQDRVCMDEFCSVGTLTISFENNSSTLSSMTFARPLIALVGADCEELSKHFLRKGFIKFFNQNARKYIFTSSMMFQMMEKQENEVLISDFQLTTIDDIKIFCECKMSSKKILFPPNLQFLGDGIDFINEFDQLFYVKYMITPQILQQVIQIRAQYSYESPQNLFFPKNYEYNKDLELENLNYVMECQIFLEKYYKEMVQQLQNEQNLIEQQQQQKILLQKQQKQISQQQPCKFRYIQQFQ